MNWLDFIDQAPRRRVLQLKQGSPRTMDTENDDFQFNLNWLYRQLHDYEFIAYFIGSIFDKIFVCLFIDYFNFILYNLL